MNISRQQPLPSTLTVRSARAAYLDENGFTVEAYDAAWTPASLFGVRFSVPNPPRHRWAIMMHDLHHVATGYGTDHIGEAEISAWELRRGIGRLGFYVGGIVTSGVLLGLMIAPRRTLAAWRAAGNQPSLFVHDDANPLLDLTVAELRSQLGVPESGVARTPRQLHALAPRDAAAGKPAI